MNTNRKPWNGSKPSKLILLLPAFVLIACQPVVAIPTLIPTTIPSSSPTSIPSLTPTHIPSLFPTRILSIPSPTPDFSRLNEPPLPANPTQFEIGRHLFWLNCMTCHGDRGQGLTDEFRSLYVEDANCWARGCHAGHNGDMGFPIPHTIPALISTTGDLLPFATAQDLFEFLRTTHPPQNPGFLSEDDYWALTAYLLIENGRLPVGQVLGP